MISHMPYRSWCVHCVRGRGRAKPHHRLAADEDEKSRRRSRIHMDYFYLSKKEEEALPLLAILDEKTQRVFSLSMPCKGVRHQYNVAVVVKLLRCLGAQDELLKSDTEASIVALRSAVQEKLPGLGFENAVKGESQTNGPIENAIGRIEGVARTLRSALEDHYKVRIPARHPVLCWLLDYAGALITRFNRGEDGMTPYERSVGKKWSIQLPEFGECVLFKPLKGEHQGSKMEALFLPGLYLGLQEGTGLRWVGTASGVQRSWTIKRRPTEEQWVVEELNKVIGLPWQLRPKPIEGGGAMSPSSPEKDVMIELESGGDEAAATPLVERKRKGYVRRGLYIRRDVELRQFGYTEGCDGCEAARHGLAHRQHSRACKQRIAEELEKSDEGKKRVEKVKQREEKFVVAYHDREEREKAEKRRSEASGEEPKAAAPRRVRIADEGEEIDKVLRSGPGDVARDVQPASSSGQQQQAAAGGAVQAPPSASLLDRGGGDDGAMAVDQGPAGGERTGVREMDLGSLTTKADYGALTRSISLDETAELMLDEKVEEMRVLLQIGGVSVRDAYQCQEPVLAEIFLPPRLTRYAQQRGLGDGLALDLTVMDEYGQPWDFSKADCRFRI